MQYYKDIDRLSIYLDLSTFCNAGCPQCNRTSIYGLSKWNWIPNRMWTIDRIKKAYPRELNIGKVTMCGTWGDPFMVKDVEKMIYYFLENDCEVKVNTNASMREPLYWYELGVRSSELGHLEIFFDVDGIDNEMHAKYRRKTELDKVLENMEAFTLGGGKARVHTIVFEHNEKYLKEIRDLALSKGAQEVTFQKSNRYFHNGEFHFEDEKGNPDTLRRSDIGLDQALSG